MNKPIKLETLKQVLDQHTKEIAELQRYKDNMYIALSRIDKQLNERLHLNFPTPMESICTRISMLESKAHSPFRWTRKYTGIALITIIGISGITLDILFDPRLLVLQVIGIMGVVGVIAYALHCIMEG